MQLDRYLADVHDQFVAATALSDDATQQIAAHLSAAVDAAVRVALLSALSDAASEITAELAPDAVDLQLRGGDPRFTVTRVLVEAEPESSAGAPAAPADDDDATSTTRTTLRLPDSVKARVEEAAASAGVSVNTWLVRAVTAALDPAPQSRKSPSSDDRFGRQFTGWVS